MKIFIRLHRAFLLVKIGLVVEKHGGDEWKFSLVRCKKAADLEFVVTSSVKKYHHLEPSIRQWSSLELISFIFLFEKECKRANKSRVIHRAWSAKTIMEGKIQARSTFFK